MLQDALAHLASSSSRFPEDQSLVKHAIRMAAGLSSMDPPAYADTVFALIQSQGKGSFAIAWLSAVGSLDYIDAGHMLPRWRTLLLWAAERKEEQFMTNCFKAVKEAGLVIDAATSANIIATSLQPLPRNGGLPSPEYMKHVIRIMKAYGISYDNDTATLILDRYTEARQRDIGGMSTARDFQKASRTLLRFKQLGLLPTEDVLLALLGDKPSVRSLKHWRQVLSLPSNIRSTFKVLEFLGKGPTPSKEVVKFYTDEVSRGVAPTPQTLQIVIQALLSSGLRKPSKETVEQAIGLYNDYITDLRQVSSSEGAPPPPASKVPTARTYQLLLRGFASSESQATLGTSLAIAEDMRLFDIRSDPETTTSLIIILMRLSATPTEALDMYRALGRPKVIGDPPVLHEAGYLAVLSAFCSLKTWPRGIPSPPQYFEIVMDMQKAGFALASKAYTIILRQLALLAAGLPKTDDPDATASRDAVAKAIQRVHNQLTIAAGFTPDVPLWNQLMDTYQRAGRFADALRVWERMFAAGQFSSTTVSVVLDACAYAEAYDAAVRIYTALADTGFPMNVRNWNTFLECLCRLGRLDEAMKVLCLEMVGREDGVVPDMESVRILLKFAAKDGRGSKCGHGSSGFFQSCIIRCPTICDIPR
ncbi:uncharacterized protein BXZ73DRAFT_73795 [Epithele typhae]|uniref:uncharacterized protein n=1 Tax=Epithele typhae TaxID=378194 RepID=UPI00200850C2|nr:uncharacterized protein BXZ73DRAFT_73795 [Epithele typhae]KAH9944227.1 hypothetical protein BXZ73DRAFT_73795 [Epithele typhae]